jgi:anti-anti-sigma factor
MAPAQGHTEAERPGSARALPPAPLVYPGFSGLTGPSGMDDGVITVRGMDSVALAFLGMQTIREHQASIMQERLLGLADRARGRIAVCMSEVADMTSAGINALVAVNARCRDLGGHLALFALGRELKKMIRVTKLDRAIIIVDTAHEAVRSFEAPPRRGLLQLAMSWARHDKDAA